MQFIAIRDFCQHHGVEVPFIRGFIEFGLVQVYQQENEEMLPLKDIKKLERMLRLAQDLNINLEGIDIILNMRSQLKKLHKQNRLLQEKINRLEAESHFRLLETPGRNGFITDLENF